MVEIFVFWRPLDKNRQAKAKACAEDAEEKKQRFAEEGKGEIRGSLHCETDDGTVRFSGRDDAFSFR